MARKALSPIVEPPARVEEPATRGTQRTPRLIAFGWYGGKFSHLKWLLPLLPECHHYCEAFAGSAAVLLNREPSPVRSRPTTTSTAKW